MKKNYTFCLEKAKPGELMEEIIDLITGPAFNEDRQNIAVAFEEAFMNVCRHAYEEDGPIIVKVEITSRKISVIICDCGIAFNPVKSPELPLFEEGRIGGHGVRLMRAYSKMKYMRVFGFNILKIWNLYK